MGRIHSGYDVYLGAPDAPDAEHPLAYTSAIVLEDQHRHTIRVKERDAKDRYQVVFSLTDTSKPLRNGTAFRWTGTDPEGNTVVLTLLSNKGGCVPCGRR
jgi:hypothetical protein